MRNPFAVTLVVSILPVLSLLGRQNTATSVFGAVSAGGFHTCALSESGVAYCWGSNLWGQSGSGAVDPEAGSLPLFGPAAYGQPGRASVSAPTAVETDLVFSSISAGDRHTCALAPDGEAYCWGHNRFGQLGDGTTENRATPAAVEGGLRFSRISAGGTHTCGVDLGGTLYCWGGNWHGQAGVGRDDGRVPIVTSPVRVASRDQFQAVATGGIHTCGLDVDGLAHCWGDGRGGVLGTGQEEPEDVFSPRPVAGGTRYRGLSAGLDLTCAISVDDRLHCWGRDPSRSPGIVTPGPREVALPGSEPIRRLSVGPGYVCIVSAQRMLVGLGTSTEGGCTAPPAGSDRPVLEVSAGGNAFGQHTCALLDGGRVQCWGNDSRDQLGDSDTRG